MAMAVEATVTGAGDAGDAVIEMAIAHDSSGIRMDALVDDQGDASTLQSAKAYTDQKFGDVVSGGAFDEYKRTVDHRFNNLNDRLNKVGAMGAAMSQMAFSTQGVNGDNRLGVGVGGYKGQGALSVGYSRSITPHATVTFGAAISGGESSGGVGVGVGW